ncbi:hypothetical protein PENTCL1PPCAC_6155 [Pristionchus entomophagus]|uniref:Protein kinase domain-containing protein n=1 Tax=Pristionchus entomophagus TaxID=358040 RepID=A0AAV5SN58_9BILA|nr:hypothetical protein PENTCL1PPCAC_6155 [Pristionchus entomophagus]
MAVFADIQKCVSPIDKNHFVNMIDKGKSEKFKFIIMEIVSYSLMDIRTNMMKNFTSQSTIIQIGRQTIQSIEALHYIGYVHRDIKPHNIAIGVLHTTVRSTFSTMESRGSILMERDECESLASTSSFWAQ